VTHCGASTFNFHPLNPKSFCHEIPSPPSVFQAPFIQPALALFFQWMTTAAAQRVEHGTEALKKLFDAASIGVEASCQGEYQGILGGGNRSLPRWRLAGTGASTRSLSTEASQVTDEIWASTG